MKIGFIGYGNMADAAGGPDAFAGKVLLDINNPVVDAPHGHFLVKTLDGKSLAEAIAASAPAAEVCPAAGAGCGDCD